MLDNSIKSRDKKTNIHLTYTGTKPSNTKIHLIQYADDLYQETKIHSIESLINSLKPETVNWIRVTGLKNAKWIIELCAFFNLSYLETKDILNPQGISKLENTEDHLFFVMKYIFTNEEANLERDHACFLLKGNCIISFQESDNPLLEDCLEAIKENKYKLKDNKADALFILFIKTILFKYTEYIFQLEDDFDNLEGRLIEPPKQKSDILVEIQQKRKDYLLLKRINFSLKEPITKLLRNETKLIDPKFQVFLSDIHDQYTYTQQLIENLKELLISLLDLYVNNNDVKLNDIMKKLTVVSTLFIPLTFVVGLWGMNFEYMPELKLKYGYFLAWSIMIILAICVFFYLKRRKWY